MHAICMDGPVVLDAVSALWSCLAMVDRMRLHAAIRLGVARTRDGTLALVSTFVAWAIVAATVGGLSALATSATDASRLPLAAVSGAAWGGGMLVAIAASARGLRRDVEEGLVSLVALRGGSARLYLAGRILGLARALAALTVVAACGTGLAVALVTRKALVHVALTTLAALVVGAAFSLCMSAVCFAALGARSRGRGYAVLVLAVVVPELAGTVFGDAFPSGWGEVASIPSALATLGAALAPGTFDVLGGLRAFVVLAAVTALAAGAARVELARSLGARG